MKIYDTYKDSGIEWIGQIPEHWEVKKLNYCFETIGSGTTPTAGNKDYYEGGEFNWLQTGDLNNGIIKKTAKKITQIALDKYSTLRFYPKDSIVIAMYGATIGKTGLLAIETATNQACCVFSKSYIVESRYIFYWLNSVKEHIISLSYGGGQPNINQEQLRNLRIQVPPKAEQTAIANYLDHKTAEIDQLIADKKRLVELYQEEKTAIINQAVTKGINPDARLKDSGIEWLGYIPEHWEVKRLKYNAKIQGGFAFSSKDFIGEGIQLLKIANLYNNELHLDRQPTYLPKSFIKSHSDWLISEGDILMSMTGTLGKRDYGFAILITNSETEFLLNQRVSKIHSVKNINIELLLNILHSEYFLNNLFSIPSGTKQGNFSNENVLNLEIAFPNTLEEQAEIVQYIEKESAIIDAKIAKAEQYIKLLTEYRTALISEVVTGKVKVV